MKKTFTLLTAFGFSFILYAQQNDWVDIWQNSSTVAEARAAFQQAFQGKDLSVAKGWKQFKRWEYYYERRTYPSGDILAYRNALMDYQRQVKPGNNSGARLNASNWQLVGPATIPVNGGGAGRLNHVKLIPGTTNQFMVAASGGGIWKYDGTTWTTSTDFLTRIGFADVVINPFNTQIMYAASGDNDNADAPCVGMFKSVNGGNNWTPSGLTSVTRMYKLAMHPVNPDILLVSTNAGVYRTTDAGASWTLVSSVSNIRDIEFKPGDPNIIYAVNRNDNNLFYVSTNGGGSFTSSGYGAGLPTSANGRGALAVTPNDPNYIYMIIGNPGNNGFKGVYRSTDGGLNWTTQATTPNLLGWSSTGGDSGGQQWYDLAIAASPTDKNLVIVGGVNVWRSLDGGAAWQIAGHWTGAGAPYIHADIHDLSFDSNGITVYAGSDGGIYKKDDISNSTAWTDLSSGLAIAQMYRMGQSTQSQNKVLTGWQDNGSALWTGPSTWQRVIGGDGMECLIDYSTDTYQYGTIYYGQLYRSSNGGAGFTTIVTNGGSAGSVNEQSDWVTPYVINPRNPSGLYLGKSRIFKSADRGTSWTAHPVPGSASSFIDAIAVAPSDTNVIYVSKSAQLWRSADNGGSYSEITSGLPGLFITYIAVEENNPDKLYITLSGTSSGNKVYMSANGGVNWTNISAGLPNLSANTIVLDTMSLANAMYVGLDAGVYYRDDNNTTWTAFNTNLPNVEVSELEIQYAAQKIRAATYGRGLWESNLESGAANFLNAAFNASATAICRGAAVTFTDNSTGSPAPNSWSWSFPGGTPATSTQRNPTVTYNTNGVYSVILTVGNGLNTNTITLNNLITVNSVTPTLTLGGDTEVCAGAVASFNVSGTNLGTAPVFSWTVNGVPTGVNAANFASNILANGSLISCEVTSNATCAQPTIAQSGTITLIVKPVPPKPVITAVFGVLTSSNATGNQWMFNGADIPGATGVTYNAVKDGKYSVKTTLNGCVSQSSDDFNLKIEGFFRLYPVPTTGDPILEFYIPQDANKYSLRITNSIGQIVYRDEGAAAAGVLRKQLDLKRLGAGVYQLRIETGKKKYNRAFIKATK